MVIVQNITYNYMLNVAYGDSLILIYILYIIKPKSAIGIIYYTVQDRYELFGFQEYTNAWVIRHKISIDISTFYVNRLGIIC